MRREIREASSGKKRFTVLLVWVITGLSVSNHLSDSNANPHLQPSNPQSFHFFILKDKEKNHPALFLPLLRSSPKLDLPCPKEKLKNTTERLFLEGGRERAAVSFPLFYSVCPDCYFPLLGQTQERNIPSWSSRFKEISGLKLEKKNLLTQRKHLAVI